MAEALSQDEIDALLRGEAPPPPPSTLTPDDEDAIKKYAELVANAGGEVYSTLLGESAEMTVKDYKEEDSTSIITELEGDFVVAEMNYKGMMQGKSLVLIPIETAAKVARQMTGGGSESDFGDLEESALSEGVQSHYSSVNTVLSKQLEGDISIESPDITTKPSNLADLMPESTDRPVLITYDLTAGDTSGPVYQILPRNLISSISTGGSPAPTEEQQERAGFGESGAPPVMEAPAQFDLGFGGQQGGAQAPAGLDIDIGNLGLILDINLEIKVELGRTTRKIREVLELGPGSVIELERLSGEPVDILVNDKLFAKGEVVVIDENFGVRITDILSIEERIEAIK